MNTTRLVECAVGGALFLGPFAYALTLSGPAPASECQAAPRLVEVERVIVEPAECVSPKPKPKPKPEPEPEPEPEPIPDFAAPLLLVDGDYLIFDSDAKAKWGEGRLFEPPAGTGHGAAKRATPDQVPASRWNLGGRTYDIYGSEGKLCTAEVGELLVIAQYEDSELVDLLEPGQQPELSPKQVRALVWETQSRWLVGRLQGEGECEGGLWARDAALPPPVVLRSSDPSTALAEERLQRFRASKELSELEAAYREWHSSHDHGSYEAEPWDELLEYTQPSVRSWVDAEGRERVISLDFGRPATCGSFDTELDSIEERIEGELVRLEQSNSPSAVVDADLDGRLEYLYQVYDSKWRTLRVVSETKELQRSTELAHDFACPC